MANHTLSPQPTTSTNNTVYIPWAWTITSADPTLHTCPSVSGILTTFAFVNAIASFLSVVFGHRAVVAWLTRGKLGKPSSKSWTYTWIISVGLNLVANAIIAGIIKNSAGYKADFKVWELILFLLARPRLSWIVLGAVAGSGGGRVSVPLDEQNLVKPRLGPFSQNLEYQPVYVHEMAFDHMNNSTSTLVKKQYDLPWINSFLSSFIAEVLMQLAALYIMGRTVRFAWKHGYYNVGFNHHLYKSVPHGAHLMYAGALYYLIGGSLSLAITIICIFIQFILGKDGHLNPMNTILLRVIGVTVLLCTTFLGSWLFWAGFVRLAGHLYCPPKLASHAAVWTLASMVGVLFGAGV